MRIEIFSRHYLIKLSYMLIDMACLSVAIWLAVWLRKGTLPVNADFYYLYFHPANSYRYLFYFWIVVSIFFNNSNGLYQTKREVYETVELTKVIKAVCLSSLFVIVVIYVAKIEGFPRTVLFLGAIIVCIFFSVWRVLKRILVHYLVSKGYNNFNVLIVGSGKIGQTLAHEIQTRPGLGFNVVGFLDDDQAPDRVHPQNRLHPKVLGSMQDFSAVARREFVHKVFITHYYESPVFLKILEQAKQLKIAVRVVPHGFEMMSGELSKYNIGLIPILEYFDGDIYHIQVSKRIFDFILSCILSVILFPVFMLIALFIKLDSRGPVFYFSKRYGRSGRMFYMLKFRSMVKEADKSLSKYLSKNEVDGPIFKMRNDPRVTRVGKFLRKYSLDELPQIFNVLLGDMSLVGPRPFPIDQVEREDFRQLRRLEVRPGITGLWQVRGRSDISFSRLLRWDVWYINNWSLWLDINILVQTIPAVLKCRGAY